MCHVGVLSKALGILVWILGPESTVARIIISMKNVSMCSPRAREKREDGAVLALSGGEGSSILNLIWDTHWLMVTTTEQRVQF